MTATSDSQTAGLDKFVRDAVTSMEIGSTNPYAPSFAGPNSSLAFGGLQNDIGHQGTLANSGMSAASVLTQALTDYAAANNTNLSAATISQIVAKAKQTGITAATLNAAFPGIKITADGSAVPITTVIQNALSADANLVQKQDDAAAATTVGYTKALIAEAQNFSGGAGVLDENNLDPNAVAMIAAWINQTGAPELMTEKLSELDHPITNADIQTYLSQRLYFNGGGGNLTKWEQRIATAVSAAFAGQPGTTSLSDPSATSPTIPTADSDGDVNGLGDIYGGGTGDPNESSESDEQLINIGGQGVDLRSDMALHSTMDFFSPTAVASSIMDAVASVFGLQSTTTNNSDPSLNNLGPSYQAYGGDYGAMSAAQYELMQGAQLDPYDPNYAQVYAPITPQTLTMPTLSPSALTTKSTKVITDMNASLSAMGEVTSDMNAVYVTQNRMFSAYNAGDLGSFVKQANALNAFIKQLSTDEGSASTTTTAVANDMTTYGIHVTATSSQVASLQNNIATQGIAAFPADMQTIIETYLPSATEQGSIANFLSTDVTKGSSVPTSLTTALQAQAATESLTSSTLNVGALTDTTVPALTGFAVYRFFDSIHGTHFFTADSGEKDAVLANRPDLVEETNDFGDTSYHDPNATAVYRFFDTEFGTHFFTADLNEKATLLSTRPDLTFESSATFYEHGTQQLGDVAVYRFFDTNNGTHFYTGDQTEYHNLTTAGAQGYRPDLTYEGVGFYAPSGSYR